LVYTSVIKIPGLKSPAGYKTGTCVSINGYGRYCKYGRRKRTGTGKKANRGLDRFSKDTTINLCL
jgi:hypothetical protein